MSRVEYPYLPKGREIKYVPAGDLYMSEAREFARHNSLDYTQPTGSVIVKGGDIIGRGANGSDYHKTNECERVKQKIPTGQGYELCEGCHPKNHSEPRAIEDAKKNGHDTNGADLYLWGHWWLCEPCWKAIISAGIKDVYVMEKSHELYNKAHPENVIGKQFA
jgi:deoxycytidylate deaminase